MYPEKSILAELKSNSLSPSLSQLKLNFNLINIMSWVWWFTPVILALGRLRQETHEFEASLGYTE
jgi:hypothetical protein